jgi:hypothetical protein
MKALAERKSRLKFATADTVFSRGRRRAVCVEATPLAAVMRLKGESASSALHVSWATLYSYAAEMTELARRNRMRVQRAELVKREQRRVAR